MGHKSVIVFVALALVTACVKKEPTGHLVVHAPIEGAYEVYRIESESPLPFVAEQVGHFNQSLSLVAGNYLILADCSNETVIIRPDTATELVAHEIRFVPPLPPGPEDEFKIQCNRFDKTRSRQSINHRFSLSVLSGKRELLVGMVPLTVDFGSEEGNQPARTVTYPLASLQVAAYEHMPPSTLFFVEPAGDLLAVTQAQEFGHWQFLLPGRYLVEVNGTELDVDLAAQEQRVIHPAFLEISVPDGFDKDLAVQISGNPIYVELNGQHWLNLQESYPVLPGELDIRLSTATKSLKLALEEEETYVAKAKSVTVNYDCSPWEWLCLGSKAVYLYERDAAFAFAVGMTDVPLLYFEEEVWVSVEGSRDIKVKVSKLPVVELSVGKIKLIPNHVHRAGQITDLARIESGGAPVEGQSSDMELDRPSEIPLIAGNYHFAQYISALTPEGERRKLKRPVTIHAHDLIEIPFTVYVSDKKMAALKATGLVEGAVLRDKRRKISLFRPALPLRLN